MLVIALLGLCLNSAGADVIFDSFDADGGFHPQLSHLATEVRVSSISNRTTRFAAQFTVVGGDYTFDSVTIPISLLRDVTDNVFRVRLTEDDGGAPGTTIEVLSENEDIWPAFSIPFTTTTTLTSTLNPLLNDGGTYWIVTEPSSIPAAATVNIQFFWYRNTSGSTMLVRQQGASGSGVLVADPWTGVSGNQPQACRVEGTPEAAAASAIPALSKYGFAVLVVLLAGAGTVTIRRIAG